MSTPLDQISRSPIQLFDNYHNHGPLSQNKKRKREEKDFPLSECPGFQGCKVTVYYPNGDIYEGEVEKATLCRKKHLPNASFIKLEKLEIRNIAYGRGEMRYPNGTVYKGSFLDEKPDGPGQLYCETGKLLYTGGWQKGKKNGDGKEFGVDGIYEGKFKNGCRHGKGTLFMREESGIYIGEWYDGLKQGLGTEVFPSKRVYSGRFHLGKPHGWGTLFSNTAEVIYQGPWNRGQPDE